MEMQEFINKIKTVHENNDGDTFIVILEKYDKYLCNCNEEEYLKQIETIHDVGLKYLLQAVIEEATHSTGCLKLYELASKNDCTLALYKLARLYDEGKMFKVDVIKIIYYYYQYYKKIGDVRKFIDISCGLWRNQDKLKLFMESYCDLISQNNESHNQCNIQISLNNKLQNDIVKLKERITELEYAPDGIGYNECKEHFNMLAEKSK